MAREALSDPDPLVRQTALGAAWRLDIIDAEALAPFFADPDVGVARRAVTLAARLTDHDLQTRETTAHRLVPLLNGPLAETVSFALGELEVADDTVVAALARAAQDAEDPLVRESSIAALGALGRGRETVLAAMGDVATVRRRAVIALANFDGPEADEAIASALHDRDWQVRQVAEDLLGPPADSDIDG